MTALMNKGKQYFLSKEFFIQMMQIKMLQMLHRM